MIKLISNEFKKIGYIKLFLWSLIFVLSILIYYYVNKKVISKDFVLILIPFIGIVVSIIFSGIMSNEYSNGTFRIYLTKPIKRSKILISKLLTIIIYISYILIQNMIIYIYLTKKVDVNFVINYIKDAHSLLLVASIIIMLSTIIKTSTISSGIVIMLLTFGFPLFEILSTTIKINIFQYTFLPYLDLKLLENSDYINELLNVSLSMEKALIINFIYAFIFIIISIIIFIKKDIKN